MIRHPVWGTHAFVGSIFADVPLDAPVLQKLLPQPRSVVDASPVVAAATDELLGTPNAPNSEATDEQSVNEAPPQVPRKVRGEKVAEVRAMKHDDKC